MGFYRIFGTILFTQETSFIVSDTGVSNHHNIFYVKSEVQGGF